MAAIFGAILDFSARTNFRQCIPLVSQTTDYKVHSGICHVLLYFYEHPTFILALKVTLLIVQYSFILRIAIGRLDSKPSPEVIKLFSCSTQLSMKFYLLINVTIVGILTFMSGKIAFSAYRSLNNVTFLGIFILMSI